MVKRATLPRPGSNQSLEAQTQPEKEAGGRMEKEGRRREVENSGSNKKTLLGLR